MEQTKFKHFCRSRVLFFSAILYCFPSFLIGNYFFHLCFEDNFLFAELFTGGQQVFGQAGDGFHKISPKEMPEN